VICKENFGFRTIKMPKKKNKTLTKKEKLRILAVGDIHGDSSAAKKLAKKAAKEKVDLVVLTGDLFGMVQSKNIIKPFLDEKQKVVFVPGNWETTAEAKEFEKKYGIKDIGHHYLKYKDVGIFGIGTPDWNLFPDKRETFKQLEKEHKKIKGLEKKIMISHLHASGTKSELSGVPGSEGLRQAVEKFQPDFFLHSHIHELEGVEEKIGKTKVINVGKKGKIIEI